jgi:acetylornithine/succinyldiaminopimelate/putrescine aminotransferase
MEGLKNIAEEFNLVEEIRGRGLMIGCSLADPWDAGEIMHDLLDAGVIVGTAGDNALRFVPPLIIIEDEITKLLEQLRSTLEEYEAQ